MANNYYELRNTSEGGINRKEMMQASGFTAHHKNYMLKIKKEVIVRVWNCSSRRIVFGYDNKSTKPIRDL
jgi:hypothetical protein